MKVKDYRKLKSLALEYANMGMDMMYFNREMATEFYNRILNYEVKIDNSVNGDANAATKTKILTINESRINKLSDPEKALILFHEFTHICNSIHEDIFEKNGYIPQLKNNIHRVKGERFKDLDDPNEPTTYVLFGGLLIDEVVSEYVATEMVKKKYNITIPLKNKQKRYGNNVINYRSHFDYYGIGEEIVNDFAKTLFLDNNVKGIDGLCRQIFYKDFPRKLIIQYNERAYSLEALVDELGRMGMIAFTEEQMNGRLLEKEKIHPNVVYNAYRELQELLRDGYEDRENIPGSCKLPSFIR